MTPILIEEPPDGSIISQNLKRSVGVLADLERTNEIGCQTNLISESLEVCRESNVLFASRSKMKEEMFGPIASDQIDYELLDEEIEHINGRAAVKKMRTLANEEDFDREEDDDSN